MSRDIYTPGAPTQPLETNAQISSRARRFLKPQASPSFLDTDTVDSPTRSQIKQQYSPSKAKAPRKLIETRNLLNYQASILDENRIVLYKKGKQLGDGYYIIEISSNSTSLYITAFNVEVAQSLVLQINGPRSKEFLSKFDYDFE